MNPKRFTYHDRDIAKQQADWLGRALLGAMIAGPVIWLAVTVALNVHHAVIQTAALFPH